MTMRAPAMLVKRLACIGLLLLAPTLAGSSGGQAAPPASSALAEGGRALAAGDLDAAASSFEAARVIDGSSALAWLGLAEVAERRGELLEALELARGALARAPRNAGVLKVLSRLQIRLGAPREALDSLALLREVAPADPAGYLTAAAVLRDVERPQQAMALLQEAEAEAPSPEVSAQLGLLQLETGASGEALERARSALERWPQHAGLELVTGLALLAEGSGEAAVSWLERALERGAPGEGRIQLALGEAKLDGCSEAAVGHFERAVELLPALPEAHYKLALGLRACGEMDRAKAALGRFQELSRRVDAADHRRRRTGAALNEVQELAAAGDLEAALSRLDELAAETPDDDRLFTLRAKLLFSAGRAPEALAAARRAQELMPSRVEGHYLEGLFLSQAGELAGARAALECALAIDPERFEVLKLYGAVLAEQGALEEAAEVFERALAAGRDPLVHLAYARVLEALGRPEQGAEQMALYEELRGQ